jgi:hypothetical protein
MSLTGFLITYANCPIYWASHLQTEKALSTAKAEYTAILSALCKVIVGTLNDRYIHNVPLPCAPLIQSTRLVTCNVTVTRGTGNTCYIEQVPRIPTQHDLSRLIARICKTKILPLLPVGLI